MKKEISVRWLTISLVLIVTLAAWLYKDSFSSYFFQDDWFTLKISSAESITDVLNFFIPRTDVVYYRPLGMQLPFFFLKSIFGINPLPFHLLIFATHILNIVLVFLLIRELIKENTIALLSSFFYATSATHYTPFFWPSTYSFILGPTMFLLSFFLFLRFLAKGKKSYVTFSFSAFILGLLSNEIVFVLPLVLFFYLWLLRKRKVWKFLIPYIFAGGIFFLGRFLLFPATLSSDYNLSIGKHLLNNLQAYLFWSFNWPEEMKAQLVRFFMFNPQFVKEFRLYVIIFVVTLMVNILFFCIIPLINMILHKVEKRINQLILLGLFWFVVGLTPVLFFPNHVFSYYLPISLVGLLITIAALLSLVRLSYFLIFILAFNWFLTSVTTINFNAKIHWVPRRAKLAKQLIEETKKLHPTVAKTGQVIFVRSSSENKLALNGQDGLRVIYNNETILTVYGYGLDKESL